MTHTDTPLNQLLHVLNVEATGEGKGHAFLTGESLYFPTGRVYGGQVIAQSIMAGGLTVDSNRLPDSVHAYFIAPGDIHQEVLFDVETLRDGRSFSSRRINATQSQGAILTAIASYQLSGQQGVSFFDPAPADVPAPESLSSAQEQMQPFAHESKFADYYVTKSAFDLRHVNPSVMLGPDHKAAAADSGRQMVWMRAMTDESTPELTQLQQRALLGVGCDQIMMEPILRRTGLSFLTPGISFATIDHSMWWYGDIDATRWHLYVQDTAVAGHGRGLCEAKVYQEGRLVAAMTQEALLRVPKETLDGLRSAGDHRMSNEH